ncbi:MAG: Arylsulfatase [Verrucomicrobia subdivision 3 bacterium]|nr:Arylsulfatase [Limisphaerales bacterium]MCS1412549.1 Arylsulfatase [Limisphaerales bacterium]
MYRLLLVLLWVGQLSAAPNFMLIFCDDLGYGDLVCYGTERHRTPAIDRIAKEGMRFTYFYLSNPVCTPSRSSLMTGCYAQRVGMHEDYTEHWVLIPRSRRGLHPEEITMAEALKARGYATACIGKWHLGDQPQHLPRGTGLIAIMGFLTPTMCRACGRGDLPLPVLDQERVIEAPADQTILTQRYTEEAVKFIEANRDQSFFLIGALMRGEAGAKTPYEVFYYYRQHQLQAVRSVGAMEVSLAFGAHVSGLGSL